MNTPHLYHWTRDEFERDGVNWFEEMDHRLLVLLDVFRDQWEAKVIISPHPAALGRRLGTKVSDHNVDLHGRVLAADVMPVGMNTRAQVEHAIRIAKYIGFTSIGFYPDWLPAPGLHLGTRLDRMPGTPAIWGAVRPEPSRRQAYVSLDQALATV